MKLFKNLIVSVSNFSYSKISDRRRSCCVKNRRVEDRIKAVLLSDKGWSSSNC
ncbi:hypothetical protein [Holospora undulata]|uniref:hypothetical protein n=1 Tax=Holospora undulata TaxID=1169117 RepID=UPI0013774B2A|nr:hypothetical protein [Holospora undulata]